jgi:hypothetical protein
VIYLTPALNIEATDLSRLTERSCAFSAKSVYRGQPDVNDLEMRKIPPVYQAPAKICCNQVIAEFRKDPPHVG